MPNDPHIYTNAPYTEHERRIALLEDWRMEHDKWAADQSRLLTRLEMRQDGVEEWRKELKVAMNRTADNLRENRNWAIAQLLTIAAIVVAWLVKH